MVPLYPPNFRFAFSWARISCFLRSLEVNPHSGAFVYQFQWLSFALPSSSSSFWKVSSQIVIRNKLAEHWFGCGWGMMPQRMDLHQHESFPREWGKISGRTKLPSLSLASPPVTEASTWAWLSYLSRPKVLLFGRDIKKVAFSLEPFSISRSILSSWSNAFLKDFHNTMDSPTALRRTQTLYRNGSVPICSLSQAIAFKCPTQIWMIFSWSMSEKARASQRVTIAKWCFQVVQSRSGTKRRAVVE